MTLQDYLTEFKSVSKDWFGKQAGVLDSYNFFKAFFKKENLEIAKWPDFQALGNHINAFKRMELAKKKALGRPNHPIEHYRHSLIYLVHGEEEIEDRINKFVSEKKYRIRNFGSSVISELLGWAFPERFVMWNQRDRFALKYLKIEPVYVRGDGFAQKFLKFNKAVEPIMQEYQQVVGKQTNLPLAVEVDQFFSYLYEKYHEKKVIQPPPSTPGARYWVMSPGRNAEFWPECVEKGIIVYGADELPDLRQFKTKAEITAAVRKASGQQSDPTNDGLGAWQFVNEIKEGDYIFAKRGIKEVIGYGRVESGYYRDETRLRYRNVRKVKWISQANWAIPKECRVPQKTLTEVSANSEFMKWIGTLIDLPPGTNFWWLNANPGIWDFEQYEVGEKQTYSAFNEKGNKRRIFRYFQEAKKGDVIVAFVTSPKQMIAGLCEVTKPLHETEEGQVIEFIKKEQLDKPIPYSDLQSIPELKDSEPLSNHQGSLFRLSAQEFGKIHELIERKKPPKAQYGKRDALAELFLEESDFDEMLCLLKEKKNIILQGPPGVGKSFIAKRLAYNLIGTKDNSKIEMIQFHQSYSYEDFIQGYRPNIDGKFYLKNGVFYEFCKKARSNPSQDYVFIIDEINRGNLSKILGELMLLIEADKRSEDYRLALTYSQNNDDQFFITPNVHLIGMMNTADRSLAIVDYALRRRFSFIDLQPEFINPKFAEFLQDNGVEEKVLQTVIDRMEKLNSEISKDTSNLGKGYCIGHSYFCPPSKGKYGIEWYNKVIRHEIAPLIREYWFDKSDKAESAIKKLLMELE